MKKDSKNHSHHVIFENDQQKVNIGENIFKLLEEVAISCLEQENIDKACEIAITITDDSAIREINREFRGKDSATDVLSFPIVNMINGVIQDDEGDYNPENEMLMLGDIVISIDTALKQADEYGHLVERELAFLTSHGVYHLLGYDHMDTASEKIMIGKQESVLSKLGLFRNEK